MAAVQADKWCHGASSSGGHIIETEGLGDSAGREEKDFEDQNYEDEARAMMLSWERSNLLKEVEELRQKFGRDTEEDFARYYDGTQSFEELKGSMISLDEYIHYRIVEDPQPDSRKITHSDSVYHDRSAFLEFNPIPFDSTMHDTKPCILRLAEGPIIPGLLRALLEFHQGVRAEVLIHPRMAYGILGCPPLIPADSHVFFNIKIHKVWGESELDSALEYERAWHLTFPLNDKIKLAVQQKDAANQYLADDQPKEALVRYKAAIMWLSDASEEEIHGNDACKQLLNVLYQNKAITLNKLGAYKSATKAAKQALNIDPRNIKAMYQLAKARIALGDHERALRVLEQAKTIAPSNVGIKQLRLEIDCLLTDEKKKRDDIMRKMAKGCVY